MSPSVEVFVFSTGSVQIRKQHVGPTNLPTFVWLLVSKSWTRSLPINVYVLKHPNGTVVFDTGQDPESVLSDDYFPRGIIGWLYGKLARFSISRTDSFVSGLADLGLTPSDVDYVVLSHLHQDHIGGLSAFQGLGTRILVSSSEVDAAKKKTAQLDGYMAGHIFLPGVSFSAPMFQQFKTGFVPGFDTGMDIFGDGTVILLPLPGHTPGSMGLLVNKDQPRPVFLVGDLTYSAGLLAAGIVPGVGKKRQMKETSNQVMGLKKALPGMIVAAAHDPMVRI